MLFGLLSFQALLPLNPFAGAEEGTLLLLVGGLNATLLAVTGVKLLAAPFQLPLDTLVLWLCN